MTASKLSISGTTHAVADANPVNDLPIVHQHGQEATTGAIVPYFKSEQF